MLKKISGVLLDLNETERAVLNRLLELAEKNLDDFGRLAGGDGGYLGKDTSKRMAKAVIIGLREELDLYPVEPVQEDRGVEEWRRAVALKTDTHYVSDRRVVCVYDRCNMQVRRADKIDAQHPWVQARQEGWTPYDWKHYGEGGFFEAPGVPSPELICPAKHDKHGCSLLNGPEDCQVR